MPFFKRDGEEILSAPTFVSGPDYELAAAQKDTYTYPVHGWFWFDSMDAAIASGKLRSGEVPTSVSMRQAQLALLQKGWLDDVEAAVAASSREVQINWATNPPVERTNPLVNYVLKNVLGRTDLEIDEVFQLAASIE